MKKDIVIEAADGFPLAATYFEPPSSGAATIVLGSALGVPRYIYFKLARFLTKKGYSVLTFDYRGVYESQGDTISGTNMRMADWGRYDIDAVLGWALKEHQPNQLIYMGHSCGGQLLGLAPHAKHLHKTVFIASQSGFWKLWPAPQKWGLWAVWNLIPLITPWFDDFPARTLGLSSVNIPSGVARQWARWGKSPNYLWDFIPKKDLNRYQKLTFPLLTLGFSDDRYFGPPRAVRKLATYYPSADTDLRIKSPSKYNKKSIGHFGFLKDDFHDTLWKELADWLSADLELNTGPLT